MDKNKEKKKTLTIASNFKKKIDTNSFQKNQNKQTFSISNDKKKAYRPKNNRNNNITPKSNAVDPRNKKFNRKLKYEEEKLKESETRLRQLEVARQQEIEKQLLKEQAEQKEKIRHEQNRLKEIERQKRLDEEQNRCSTSSSEKYCI